MFSAFVFASFSWSAGSFRALIAATKYWPSVRIISELYVAAAYWQLLGTLRAPYIFDRLPSVTCPPKTSPAEMYLLRGERRLFECLSSQRKKRAKQPRK